MPRSIIAVGAALVLAAAAQAHFVFVVPAAKGTEARVVFSEDLEPDTVVDISKVSGTKLFARSATGEGVPLKWEKDGNAYRVALPEGARLVYGATDYGVLRRGEGKPFRLVYHPKAVVGPWSGGEAVLGAAAPAEIVPAGKPGAVRFRLVAGGKPVAGAEVNVLKPGDSRRTTVTTDEQGLTPAFAELGQFGVWARHTEAQAGERGGEKYEEVRHYPTLVVEVGRPGAARE
ncbi:MAG TPA: DUF4198 domain-containing protein [Gemmataceae bacterium]